MAGAQGRANSDPVTWPAWESRPRSMASIAPASPNKVRRSQTGGCTTAAGKSPASDFSAGCQTSRRKGTRPPTSARLANKSHLEKSALPGRLALEVCWVGEVVGAVPVPTLKVNAPSVWCPSVAETAFQLTVYTPVSSAGSETVIRVGSDGSTRISFWSA